MENAIQAEHQVGNKFAQPRSEQSLALLHRASVLICDGATKQPGHKTPPVILLAGDPSARARGKQAGADEALATPPSYGELQAAVIRTLSRPSAVASESSEEAP